MVLPAGTVIGVPPCEVLAHWPDSRETFRFSAKYWRVAAGDKVVLGTI